MSTSDRRRQPALPSPDKAVESSIALVARARNGDTAALDDLCTRYLPRLRQWAHGRLPSWARDALDTHDIAQETLWRVVRRIRTFEPRHDAAFQAYVRQALFNRLRDEIRRARTRPGANPLDSRDVSSAPSPLEQAIGREALDRYEKALKRLRAEDREAIILRLEMGYSHTEVAEALDKPSAAAAQMAVSRAVVRLVKEMARIRPQSGDLQVDAKIGPRQD